jgi:uncharacterized protein YijF (DUF1287 family)
LSKIKKLIYRVKKRSFQYGSAIIMGWALLVAGWGPVVHATLAAHFTPETLVQSAREQIGQTVEYDGSYKALAYPMGDVPLWTGVCSDVVIRSLRSFHLDLQKEVSCSIALNHSAFVHYLTKGQPDRSIDHRRVKVLVQYFHLNGWDQDTDAIKPGDIVVIDLNNGQWHIAIVSNTLSKDKKRWLVIHNWGNGVQEEDVLDQYPPFRCFRAPLKLIDKSHGQKTRTCPALACMTSTFGKNGQS